MKRKNYFLFFYLPFLSLILIFSFLSDLNRRYIIRQVEAVVYEQLKATAGILKKDINHLLQEGFSLEEVFEFYSGEENIYFMAVLDAQKNVLGWSSRFEGYLPLSARYLEPEKGWVIESPRGKIYNYFTAFPTDEAVGADETTDLDKAGSTDRSESPNESGAVGGDMTLDKITPREKSGPIEKTAASQKISPAGASSKADPPAKSASPEIAGQIKYLYLGYSLENLSLIHI